MFFETKEREKKKLGLRRVARAIVAFDYVLPMLCRM